MDENRVVYVIAFAITLFNPLLDEVLDTNIVFDSQVSHLDFRSRLKIDINLLHKDI